jgi:hypothetical protein
LRGLPIRPPAETARFLLGFAADSGAAAGSSKGSSGYSVWRFLGTVRHYPDATKILVHTTGDDLCCVARWWLGSASTAEKPWGGTVLADRT